MKRIFIVFVIIVSLLFLHLLSRLPIFKKPINNSDFYYRDIFGRVFVRRSECGFIGSCSYYDVPIWKARSSSFKVLSYKGLDCLNAYAKTNKYVYYLGKEQFQVKDPASFEILNNLYAKDSQNVYNLCDLKPLEGISASSFTLIGPVCAKSSEKVFCFKQEVENADPPTFSHISRGYYKDKNHVYHLGKILEGATPDTFDISETRFQTYFDTESGLTFEYPGNLTVERTNTAIILKDKAELAIYITFPNLYIGLPSDLNTDFRTLAEHYSKAYCDASGPMGETRCDSVLEESVVESSQGLEILKITLNEVTESITGEFLSSRPREPVYAVNTEKHLSANKVILVLPNFSSSGALTLSQINVVEDLLYSLSIKPN